MLFPYFYIVFPVGGKEELKVQIQNLSLKAQKGNNLELPNREGSELRLKVLGKSVGGENAKVPRYEVKW